MPPGIMTTQREIPYNHSNANTRPSKETEMEKVLNQLELHNPIRYNGSPI